MLKMNKKSAPLQSGFSWNCYGCGKCNERGLQAKTIKTEKGYLCNLETQEEYVAHPGKYHHGLITTICFCHGAWSATAESYEAEGKSIADPLEYFYVNKKISYEIQKPIPINATASIYARVHLGNDSTAEVDFEVLVDKVVCATAKTSLVKVYATEMVF